MENQRRTPPPSPSEEDLPSEDETADSFLRAAARLSGESEGSTSGARNELSLSPGMLVAKRYQLDRLLGSGGMGVVWAATHTVTRRPCALKFLRASTRPNDELRRRFRREARIASTLDHPNIVPVRDVAELDDGTLFTVMPLLEGETLRARLEREQRLSLAEVARLFLPVVSGVAAAHALGVVHRDLKPENIFLVQSPEKGPEVRVLDFGIAKLANESEAAGESSLATGTGTVLGTACYMAPEQALTEKEIDHRADIWALGVILYECLSGARPIRGKTVGQVVADMLSRPIEPLASLVPGLPGDVGDLIGRMLKRERDARPSNLGEVTEVLSRHVDSNLAPAAATPATGPQPAHSSTARRLALLALGAAALAGVIAFRTSGGGTTPDASTGTPLRPPGLPDPAARAGEIRPPPEAPAAVTAPVPTPTPSERPRVTAANEPVRSGLSGPARAVHASPSARPSAASPPPPSSATPASVRKGLVDHVPF